MQEVISIIEQIFKGKELTIFFDCNGKETAVLNKWSITRPQIDIPIKIANYLISFDILILDSGNTETREQHYIYQKSKNQLSFNGLIINELKPILRKIKLDFILND